MAKITPTTVSSGFASTTAIDANFNALAAELNDKVLYRDNPAGEPNSMQNNLDMNGYAVINHTAVSGDLNFSNQGDWATSTTYLINNLVYVTTGESATNGGTTYICTTNHASGAGFDADLAAYWQLFSKRGATGPGTGDLFAANNLSDVSSASTSRTNLGLSIGSAVQAWDATLQSISDLTPSTGEMLYTTGIDTFSTTPITAAGRALLDDASAPVQRITLGLTNTILDKASPGNIGTDTPAEGQFTILGVSGSLSCNIFVSNGFLDSATVKQLVLSDGAVTLTAGTDLAMSGTGSIDGAALGANTACTTLETSSNAIIGGTLDVSGITTLDSGIDLIMSGGGSVDGAALGANTDITSLNMSGNIAVAGTVDGRDVATDGTKLDTLTALAIGTSVASTSGTSINFTSIPAGTKRITINFSGVSVSGTSSPIIQLGDAGGVEATGYLGSGTLCAAAANFSSLFTAGFGIFSATAANLINGSLTLTLLDASTFTWAASGNFGLSNTASTYTVAGSKPLSAELDRVRITTVGGSDTFDAGIINIQYEG